MSRDLAKALHRSAPESLTLVWGVVRAVHTSPNSVDVSINGASAPDAALHVAYDASYTPTVNDTVAVLRTPTATGCDHYVIGKRA
jgi:hypothetical protein